MAENNEDFHSAEEYVQEYEGDEIVDEIKNVSNEHSSYKMYRRELLGKDTPDRTDSKCDFYLLNTINQITKFSKIKSSFMNFELNEDHIQNIVRHIEKSKELYYSSIALLEYQKYYTDSPKHLIDVVDGHHRIEALKKVLKNNNVKKFNIWVQIYKTDNPTCKKSVDIFKIYNSVKPFKINLELVDFKILLSAKLNEIFTNKNTGFELIKDSANNVNRPYIQKKKYCDKLEDRLKIQIQVTGKDLDKKMIDNIANKFQSFNTTLLYEKDINWFNDTKNSSYFGFSATEKQYETAKTNKCMLGLVKLEFLISHCVSL